MKLLISLGNGESWWSRRGNAWNWW